MSLILTKKIHIAEEIYRKLEKELAPKDVGRIRDRVAIVGELYKFKAEVVDIWSMKKGQAPEGFEILWDSEFVIRFTEDEPMERVMLRFWDSLAQMVASDKISFKLADKLKMDEIEALKELENKTKLTEKEKANAKKMVDSLKTAEEKELATIAIEEVKKERKKKRSKKLIL